MRRWLVAWGPPLFGLALSTGAAMGAAALALGGYVIPTIPCVVTAGVALIYSLWDVASDSSPSRSGPAVRGEAFDDEQDRKPCASCAALRRDRDELREAIAVLELPTRASIPERKE